MIVPSQIYKRFHQYIPVNEMTGLQWFALTKSYGSNDTYGTIQKTYQVIREPKLLDIGNADVRTMIRQTIEPYDASIAKYSNPDYQYSGGVDNKKYHLLVQKYFGNEYDGTFIDETQLHGNDDYSVDDLEGPSEMVLWKNIDEILREVKTGGKSKKRRLRKSKKRQRKQTQKKIKKTKKTKQN